MDVPEIKARLRKHLRPSAYQALRKLNGYLNSSRKREDGLVSELALQEIGEPFASALGSMYRSEPQTGGDGQQHEIDSMTRVSIQEGLYLYRLCRETKARRTMEIGCGYGFSTLYFLAAHAASDAGDHVSIDPMENSAWQGIGVARAKEAGMQPRFRLVEKPSITGIPLLMDEGLQFGIIFIDGSHFFENVVVDFALSSRVCERDGLIIFDDMWMPSIRKVVSFIRRNRRDFAEVSTPVENICMFKKIDEDRRGWRHFEDFD